MKDKNKQRILIEKKIDIMSNDLFKQVATDLVQLTLEDIAGTEYSRSMYASFIEKLYHGYKDQIHELKDSSKKIVYDDIPVLQNEIGDNIYDESERSH